MWREEFPVTQDRIFFDHARVGPISQRVMKRIHSFAEDASYRGTANYDEWMAEAEQVRKSFAQLIGAEADEIAFVKNTSEGLSIVANGIDWQAGDNVVIPNIEFPANVYPWLNLKRLGVETRLVPTVDGRVLFDEIVKQVNDRTRLISISSVEFNSGFRNDLARIGAFCKQKNILFCVDAIQSLGVLPMDVKAHHIDFLAADGHKWMMSIEGLGGFYVSRDKLDRLYPAVVGWDSVVNASDYTTYDLTFRPNARRFEEGSFNVLSIHAFGAALSLFHEIGVPAIQQRVLELGNLIIDGLSERGLKIISSTVEEERSGIVAFALDGDYNAFANFMRSNGTTLTVRKDRVRLSPHFYNNEEDIAGFFDQIDRFLSAR